MVFVIGPQFLNNLRQLLEAVLHPHLEAGVDHRLHAVSPGYLGEFRGGVQGVVSIKKDGP